MRLTAILLAASLSILPIARASAADVTEPRSGVTFADRQGDLSLLGVGLRTKTFLKVKVYAIGLYVADSALAGPLAADKGKTTAPAFYKELTAGDFPREVRMKFVRDVSASQIQGAWRETLETADKKLLDTFCSYFPDTKVGQEYVIHAAPGGSLEVQVAGQAHPPIPSRPFTEAVLGIWLGEKPIQEDIKKDLVSRAEGLLR